MEQVRFVTASLSLYFEEGGLEDGHLMQEYYRLLQINEDPLGMWLRSEKIRKEMEETDQVLLTLITELHRKIDFLTERLNSDKPPFVSLKHHAFIEAIAHGYFGFTKPTLKEGVGYYGRIDMPTFPRRYIGLFFEGVNSTTARMTLMHQDNERAWSSYMAGCERTMIRQMKGMKQ